MDKALEKELKKFGISSEGDAVDPKAVEDIMKQVYGDLGESLLRN